MSSLAAQLASIASLDSSRLKAAKQSATAPSYLFTPAEAAQHDLETIHSLGVNGFEELRELDPSLDVYEDDVFGEAAKQADRLLLPLDENRRLGETLDVFLGRLSRHIPLRAAAKVIEWLVRRFRVHEMNVDGVLACFLPYHDSQQFVRILSILRIPPNSHLTFLQAPKTAHLPLSRQHLVVSLHKDKTLSSLRLVASLLSAALKAGTAHRTMIGFHASTLVGYLEHGGLNGGRIGDSALAVLIPEVVAGLSSADEDVVAANLIVLLALARKATLSPEAIHALLVSMLAAVPQQRKALSATRTAHLLSTMLGLLQSQDELQEVGRDVVEGLQKLRDVGILLAQGSAGYEVSKALRPIIVSLVKNLDVPSAASTLEAFVTSPLTPPPASLISFLTRILLLSDAESTSREHVVRILAVLKERYAGLWERESLDVLAKVDGEIKTGILGLADSVAQVDPRGDVTSVFLSLNSADSASRLSGIRSLLEKLERKGDGMDVDADAEFIASAKSNLLLRLSDTYVPVLETIYGSPSTLITTVDDPRAILTTLLGLVNAPSAGKAVVRCHLQFLAGPFASAFPSFADEIIVKAFFGLLLVTKPRQVMAQHAWEVLASDEAAGLGVNELLKGLAPSIVAKLGEKTDEKHQKQAEANELVIRGIASNIVAFKSIEGLVTFLVAQAASADVHGRLLAVLVLGEVIKAASGDAQLAAALQALDFLAASKESLVGAELLIETLLETVVLKPSAAKTSQRAKLALLLALQAVDVPRVSEVVWLEQHATSPAARWATATYAMVNSADIPLEASGPLLRNLFKSLRDDTLLFLASVWTASVDGSALVTGKLQAIALRHAEAFIQAHSQGTGSVDFQTVVPALLVALRSREKSVREGAIACLRLISAATKDKAGVPYALDSVYGAASESVQLLKGQDVKRYLDTLLSDSASLVLDPAHIVSVHQDQMTIARGEAKKDVNYKRGVLCFLLSHVAAWSSTTARIALLESARAIRDASRIELLAPLLESMLSSAAMEASDEERKMAELTLDGYDRTAAVAFAERPEAWALFKQYLAVDASSAYGRDLRQLALLQLQTALYTTLPAPLQGEIVQTLVESVLDPAAAHVSDIKACLRALAPSSAIIVALLSALRPAGDSLRSSKRNKQDAESQAVVVRAFHAGLAVLLESRSVESLEGNADLLAALLDTLSALLDSKAKADVNVDYTEQLLLTGLCSVAAKLDQTTVDPQTIDVTVVMKILSDTKNPQTFQQALLLISQFARLAPLVVLQNALPIFVSVGAHTSQRDDAFTFQVVEKTVASILPVMVAHLKEEDVDRPRLWAKSLDILQVFIGMSQHVPAHRKTRLFSNLVQVLGPTDFLGPIVMLLLNSYAQRPRSKGVDRASAFVLPSSVLNVFDLNSRFAAVLDLAVEAKTLLLHHVGSTAETSFLRQTSILPSTSITDDAKVDFRRASTILHFIQAVCQQLPSVALSDDESRSVQATVAALLPIGFVSGQDSQVEGLPELAQASQDALDAIIRTLSVPAFAASIEPMLAGDDVELRLGAIALLTSRLPEMKLEARKLIAPVATRAVNIALEIARNASSVGTVMAAFASIADIAGSATAQEDAALAPVVAVAIAKGETNLDDNRLVKRVFALLSVLSRRLGPRLIPFIKKFTAFTVAVASRMLKLPQSQLAAAQESLLPVLVESVATFVAAVPTFLGNNLAQLLITLLQPALLESADGGRSPSVHGLLNSVAKNVPPATVFPAVFQLWKDVDHASAAPSVAVLDLLKRAIRHTNRDAFASQLKPVFAFYLTALDSRWQYRAALLEDDVLAIERKLIEAFLESVIKMNEASFRPHFVRVFDWAAIDLAGEDSKREQSVARRTTFYHLLEGLFEKFRSIMTPYMATTLDNVTETLQAFVSKDEQDGRLWLQVLRVLQKSFEYDEGTFWSDEHFAKLLPVLVAQIPLTPDVSTADEAAPVLSALFASLAAATASPTFLKTLNHSLLLQTRSESPVIRSLALQTVAAVWARKGEDMLELVPQTVSGFVSEALDDVEEGVEQSARELLKVMESLVGPLSSYFGDA